MVDPTTELAQELKTLRRGRGVWTPRVEQQIGPMLRTLCGITEDDDSEAAREKVRHRLTELTDRLPDDARDAARAALGLAVDIPGEFLAERMAHLAEQQGRDIRTVRRRVDAAFDLLADLYLEREGTTARRPSDEWHLRHFEAVLLLDRDAPECVERRTIVADRDGLDRISTSITIPHPGTEHAIDHSLLIDPYFGVHLISTEQPSSTRFVFHFRLPRALRIGETHEFGVITRLPPGQAMRPHYVFFPARFCDSFDLRIRFDRKETPAEIRTVDNVPYTELEREFSNGRFLTPDRAGEIHVSFSNPTLGYGCGVQWRHA